MKAQGWAKDGDDSASLDTSLKEVLETSTAQGTFLISKAENWP